MFLTENALDFTVFPSLLRLENELVSMAAAWAVLNLIGDEGYLEIARKKIEATRRIVEGIERLEELRMMVQPDMCLLAFTSDTVNVFHIIDEMNGRGWYIQPALAFGNSKENIHMSINASNVEWVDDFMADLDLCVKKAKTMKSGELAVAVMEGLSSTDPSQLTDENFSEMLSMAGIQGTQLPDRMADINEVLNALPAEFREQLVIEFVNDLFRYQTNKT